MSYGMIGVRIARGNAEHKMARLYYDRATVEEATATCRSQHSDNEWKPGRTSNSYASHIPAGYNTFEQLSHTPAEYSTFEQFRNGHDFNMHQRADTNRIQSGD